MEQIDVTNRQQLEDSLRLALEKNGDREQIVAFASRAALRAIPLLFDLRMQSAAESPTDIVLRSFQCAAVSWVAARQIDNNSNIKRIAQYSALRAYSANGVLIAEGSPEAYESAYVAADAAAHAAATASDGLDNVAAPAADATFRFSEGTSVAALAASTDLLQIEIRQPIIQLPLWFMGTPTEVNSRWVKLEVGLRQLEQDWEVWTDWYRARLIGGPTHPDLSASTNERIEIGRVREISEGDWNQGPAHVNAKIKAIIERERERDAHGQHGPALVALEPGQEVQSSQAKTFEPLPGPYAYGWNGNRLFAQAVLSSSENANVADQMRVELLRYAKRLLGHLDDQYADAELAEDIELLLETLSMPTDEMELGVLRMRYAAIKGYADVAASGDESRPAAVSSRLAALADQVLDFMSAYEDLRTLEANRLAFIVQSVDLTKVEAALKAIRETIADNAAIDPSVLSALDVGLADVAELQSRIETAESEESRAAYSKAQSDLGSLRVLNTQNFVRRALSTAWVGIKEVTDESGREFRQELPKQIGKTGAQIAVKGTAAAAVALLVAQFSGPLGDLVTWVRSLEPLAAESETIKEELRKLPAQDRANAPDMVPGDSEGDSEA